MDFKKLTPRCKTLSRVKHFFYFPCDTICDPAILNKICKEGFVLLYSFFLISSFFSLLLYYLLFLTRYVKLNEYVFWITSV